VLAATSFVGRWLVRELSQRGHLVISAARSGKAVLRCDLSRGDEVRAVVSDSRPECIVNCVGATTRQDPESLYNVHLGGARRLLEAVRQAAPKGLTVFLGSAAEYGPVSGQDLPISEQLEARPAGFFGASKLAQTQLAQAAAAEWGLSCLVLRPFNILGPGTPAHYLPGALAARLRRRLAEGRLNAPLALLNGAASRDFIDVREVARAIAELLEHYLPKATGECEIYNIGSGRETTVLELAQGLCALAIPGLRVTDAGAAQGRSTVSRSRAQIDKLHQATGWRPQIPLTTSLRDLWQASAAE